MRIQICFHLLRVALCAAALSVVLTCASCAKLGQNGSKTPADPEPSATPFVKMTKYYDGVGKVTEINEKLGALELDHGDIPGYMTAMKMEYYVDDKSMLNGLKVGETVDFTVKDFSGVVTLSAVKPHAENKK